MSPIVPIVNDVVAAVRIASLFAHHLGIPAAPILGTDRESQLEKVYEPLLAKEGEDITAGGTHPAWRWFSPICPLLPLVKSAQKWKFGAELSQLTVDEDIPDRSKLAPTKGRGKKPIPIAITEMSDTDKIHARKELIYSLEDFFQDPLNRELGGEMSDLAWTLLTAETQIAAVAMGKAWLQGWLKSVGISIPEPELAEIIPQLHFAVLITVLGNRLGILIDRIGDITRSQRIDA